jgi:hypothetical protein
MMKNYSKLVLVLIAAWFTFALTAGAAHVFGNNANRIGVSVALAAGIPILLFGAWYTISANFRRFVLSLNPQLLTLAQSWRLLGFTFVLLEAHEVLPAVFALPAGYGDMIIGATATVAAWKLANPSWRSGFILWQALGILDLLLAVGLGTTAGLIDPNGISMQPMTALPLSLIPTFLVPLFFIFHLICIAQAKAWRHGVNPVTGSRQIANA